MSLSHAFLDEFSKIFPNGFNIKILESYSKTFRRFINLPVIMEESERVPLEAFGRIFNLPMLMEESKEEPLEALKVKYIEVLNTMSLADKFMLVEDSDMYIFQVIGCKYANTFHNSIKSSSFLCPHAMFVGALIYIYLNPKIEVNKTVLKKGGSITVFRKLNVRAKKYITKSG